MSATDLLIKELEPHIEKIVRDRVREILNSLGIRGEQFPGVHKRALTIPEAEVYTGWSSSFLYATEKAGLIKFTRTMGRTEVLREDLDRLLEAGKDVRPRDRMRAVRASAAARGKQPAVAASEAAA